MKVLYTAEANSIGDGRSGKVATTDGLFEADLAVPVEMGGPGGGNNPEQLFAAGYAACFHSALRLVGRREGADVEGSEVTARVGLGPNGSGGFALTVQLLVHLPGVEHDQAQRLAEQAHQVCPYSNATRGNIDVTLTVR
ncbi:organic hydroperoxide resistance protein [Rugosimonospora africana]|uniref:Putative organic hydroperoxide resistance protein/OsmC-like protein n=1 Tax=Rugosimonospora africana TaxID=556532 RepID=A0A8J3QXD7_9ACTN|nr:organic hydroperoxide resistance protein [Rugosimonospora africana]GIH17872.1 putative organic hydroperoxide resistance protein/OsmC-like protein [Rugosimonospora africana]